MNENFGFGRHMPRRIRDAPPEEAAQAFRRRLGKHVDPAVPDEPLLGFGDPAPDSDDVTGGSQVLPARVRWRTPRAVAILLAAALGGSTLTAMIAIGVSTIPVFTRNFIT